MNAGPRLVQVWFEFNHPTATSFCVAGTFNDWEAVTKPMHSWAMDAGRKKRSWRPGTYEYRLVVDGQWMVDPLVKETVPNPFGGRNSGLRVACPPEGPHFGSPAHLSWKPTNQFKETSHHVQPNTSMSSDIRGRKTQNESCFGHYRVEPLPQVHRLRADGTLSKMPMLVVTPLLLDFGAVRKTRR